ncbi:MULTISPECIES: hypothetical protein [Candidatus Ichthyocystis]|uniref:Putative membrane protein n=1 Tax=Candidatus Ichthyocystis hellenicum TaxID=1561003 RepID=A0A0S4M060_9BURK|nr:MULTISPECIES: hypothetical protein [Ichthyocystis]CUT17203.1 putative membrane protein [Candidatus Ichthyocystis hellenicum]
MIDGSWFIMLDCVCSVASFFLLGIVAGFSREAITSRSSPGRLNFGEDISGISFLQQGRN